MAHADRFSVHARKAWLKGLSPKENRNIPPLRYEDVYRLKQDFPQLQIEINGGIANHEDVAEHLKHVDSVMIGRAAYNEPFFFSEVDEQYYGIPARELERIDVAEAMIPYIAAHMAQGGRMIQVTRHMLHLFTGIPGARRWRRVVGSASAGSVSDLGAVERLLHSLRIDRFGSG
jgi:tRNA-dihydrouridine synthase A